MLRREIGFIGYEENFHEFVNLTEEY